MSLIISQYYLGVVIEKSQADINLFTDLDLDNINLYVALKILTRAMILTLKRAMPFYYLQKKLLNLINKKHL